MGKLIVMRGIPGSGKSTKAQEMIRLGVADLIVSRDSLRYAMFQSYELSREQEEIITKVETNAVLNGLRNGLTVVADSMHLRSRYMRRMWDLAKQEGADFEVVTINPPLPQCLLQNQFRQKRVPPEVIMDLHARFAKNLEKEWTPPVGVTGGQVRRGAPKRSLEREKVVLVDLDGTLAIHDGRSPYDYDELHTDAVRWDLRTILLALDKDKMRPVFMSGRPDSHRQQTLDWLWNYVFPFGTELYMRSAGDMRRDDIVKYELYDRHIRNKYDVVAVFDDRDRVVDMWREIGLTCFQVERGDF